MSAESTDTDMVNVLPAIDDPVSIRRRNWRMFKDRAATWGMTIGGISVIIAILLIFFYLLAVVFPMLLPADIEKQHTYASPWQEAGNTLYLDMEEQATLGARITERGKAVFFDIESGKLRQEVAFPIPEGVAISSFAVGDPAEHTFVFGLENGQAILAQTEYKVSYPNDVRTVTPNLIYPLEAAPVVVDEQGQSLTLLGAESNDDETTIVAVTTDKRLVVSGFAKEVNFLDESVTISRNVGEVALANHEYTQLLVSKDQRLLYLADDSGHISQYDISNKTRPALLQRELAAKNTKLTSMSMLLGGISVLVGREDGSISQFFPVRNEENKPLLKHIRDFNTHDMGQVLQIVPEQRRKGFVAIDAQGQLGIFYSSARRTLLVDDITAQKKPLAIALSPRAETLLVENTNQQIEVWNVHNEHPEVSISALWTEVWYESYPEPDYIWQSSSASSDFEPKFSLAPLAFGTLKAAFYAMLVAAPLAILGAIYTAYFMSPGMRKAVKPGIEIMEALPTVILGFLAGLWLAPVIESHLPGVFSLLLIMPLGIILFTYVWYCLPEKYRVMVPDEWAAALLIPVVFILGWGSLAISYPLEQVLFDGDMRIWLNEIGVDFDQRNSIVVGIAMGFAVIPTIFSITEDAVFNVPKHLTTGSLALGATPWQTLTRVVILTASPGIFSAVMIGLGRAVGETMIVLMATGNTPVMDFNIFEGMRTLSANIAVEMPESEVGSTHYRILFLAALVLFIFTFLFNTIAEIVRHRLRERYGSL